MPSPPVRSCARASRDCGSSLEAVKDIYKSAKYAGIGCGIKSTGIGNGTIDSGHALIRVLEGGRLEVLTGYTEMGQGLFTTIRQAVCEETGLPAGDHERPLGQGAGREVRRDLGVARHHAELRGGAAGARANWPPI